MNRGFLILLLSVAMGLTSACNSEKMMSEKGFRLPEGDPIAGKEAFLYMHCNQCHTIEGENLPTIPGYEPFVELGGAVTRVQTYGELVTSIINPSHKLAAKYPRDVVSEDGESKMYVYNSYMTIQELTDIVMYLQPKYEVVVPEYNYRIYP